LARRANRPRQTATTPRTAWVMTFSP
jgi:hypothetical protein